MAKYKLNANESHQIAQTGRYFRVFTAASELKVRILSGSSEYFYGYVPSGVQIRFTDLSVYPQPFDKIIIESETAQEVTLWHSLADTDDDRLSGNFDVNAALTVANTAPSAHSVKAIQNISTSTEVLPALSTRKTALIQVDGDVYVGSTDGVKLSGLFSWENQSALTLIPVTGTVEVRINEDYA